MTESQIQSEERRNIQPKVSIVTPSFNQGCFIEETILSVLNQDYPNIEYIVIDGGSTDKSTEIIKKYQDRLAYWVSEPDRGQTDAINKGLLVATGDIYGYLNSDDLLDSKAASTAVAAFEKHPEAEFVYGDFNLIDSMGTAQFSAKAVPFDKKVLVYGRTLFNQPSSFWRRSVTEKIGYLDVDYDFCMDQEYWIRAVSKGVNFLYVPGLYASTRIHGGTKTSTVIDKLSIQHRAALNKNNLLPFKNMDLLNKVIFLFLQKTYRIKGALLRAIINRDFRLFAARYSYKMHCGDRKADI